MSEVDDKLIGSNVLDQERTWFLPIPGFISSTGYRGRGRERERERERERKSECV